MQVIILAATATFAAGFDFDVEYPLQALSSNQRGPGARLASGLSPTPVPQEIPRRLPLYSNSVERIAQLLNSSDGTRHRRILRRKYTHGIEIFGSLNTDDLEVLRQ
jgi:hypothetical protein